MNKNLKRYKLFLPHCSKFHWEYSQKRPIDGISLITCICRSDFPLLFLFGLWPVLIEELLRKSYCSRDVKHSELIQYKRLIQLHFWEIFDHLTKPNFPNFCWSTLYADEILMSGNEEDMRLLAGKSKVRKTNPYWTI